MLTSAFTSQSSQIKDVAILITQGTYAIAQEEGNCQSFSPILGCDFHGFHGVRVLWPRLFLFQMPGGEVLGARPRELDQIATASRAIR